MAETNRLGAVRIERFIRISYDVPRQNYMNMTDAQIKEYESSPDLDWREQLTYLDIESAGVSQVDVSVTFVYPEVQKAS